MYICCIVISSFLNKQYQIVEKGLTKKPSGFMFVSERKRYYAAQGSRKLKVSYQFYMVISL